MNVFRFVMGVPMVWFAVLLVIVATPTDKATFDVIGLFALGPTCFLLCGLYILFGDD